MGSRYLTEMAARLKEAGCQVVEYEGWQTRARSSGGFDSGKPTTVMWHHTASSTTPENDASYMCYGSADRPIANLLIARDGTVWVLAAGACNTNGKGGPSTMPDGVTVPKDSMNTWAVGIEIANNGVGEPYPVSQIDAAFKASIAISAMIGRPVDSAEEHQSYAPDRKIDPATASAVQGDWHPATVTSSGTWSQNDLRAELRRRATSTPEPGPMPPLPDEEDDVSRQLVKSGRPDDSAWNAFIVHAAGKFWLSTNEALAQAQKDFGYFPITVDKGWMEASGPVFGPNPTDNAYGVWSEAGSLSAAVADPAAFTAEGGERDAAPG